MEQHRCGELRSRLRATQEQNEVMSALIERTKQMIKRSRLERSVLMERIEAAARSPSEDVTPPQSPLLPPTTEEDLESAAKKASHKLPNAYTVFCDEERAAVQESLTAQGIQLKPSNVQKALSDKWKLLGKEERKPYAEKAKEIKKSEAEGEKH